MKESLYIVLPAYNEEGNIETVVRSWYSVLEGKDESSRMLVADGGSSDRTHEILTRLKEEFPKLAVLSETGKSHGEKLMFLYGYGISHGATWIFQTDSDGQTDPAEFKAFWDMRAEYDGIFGNRTARRDGMLRGLVEKAVCLLLRLYFGVEVPDANAPFRLMRADAVKKYISRMPPGYNLPNIMLTAYFSFYGEKCAFRPISFRPRQSGKNSVNIPRIMGIGWKALGDFRRFRTDMKKQSV